MLTAAGAPGMYASPECSPECECVHAAITEMHHCLLLLVQSNLGRDKSGAHTTFDAAAASALVEMNEYRSDGLQVRKCCCVDGQDTHVHTPASAA